MGDWSRPLSTGAVGRTLSLADNWNMPVGFGTNNGGANTKGSWTQMLASCPFDADGFILNIFNNTGSPCDWLVDIGIGGSGSEVVYVPDIYVRAQQNDNMGEKVFIPMAIPAGTRISGRCQNNSGSGGAPGGQIIPVQSGMAGVGGYQKCTALGVVTASSRGTQMTQDNGVGWVSIADPIPECKGFLFSAFPAANYTTNQDTGVIDIAVGPSGGAATQLIAAGMIHRFPLNGQGNGCLTGWWPIRLPGGCALFIRANGLGYAGKAINAAVYGFQ